MALRAPVPLSNCERAATADTLWRRARLLRTSPEFWMGLPATHDLTKPQLNAVARSYATVRRAPHEQRACPSTT
jgi:plasmid maintenance system antidote protein VapI